MRISDWSSDVCSSDLRIAFQNVTEGDVMSKRAKVLFVPLKQFEMLMRGGLSGVRNFPGDASVEAVSLAKDGDGESGFALPVQSATYQVLEPGEQLPSMPAPVLRRWAERRDGPE